jgi:hypothetical protein
MGSTGSGFWGAEVQIGHLAIGRGFTTVHDAAEAAAGLRDGRPHAIYDAGQQAQGWWAKLLHNLGFGTTPHRYYVYQFQEHGPDLVRSRYLDTYSLADVANLHVQSGQTLYSLGGAAKIASTGPYQATFTPGPL